MTDWATEMNEQYDVWDRLERFTADNVLIIDGRHRGEMVSTRLMRFAFRGEDPIYESYKIRLQLDHCAIDLRCASHESFDRAQTAVWFYLINSEVNSVL